jgi:hypothetical protein
MMMRSMTPSSYLRWGRLEAPLPLQVMVTIGPPSDNIDACNDDLIVAIIKVIAWNIVPTENLLILVEDLFGLNQLEKNY